MRKGTKHNSETLTKLRESHLGQKAWNKGKKLPGFHSQTTKEKIRTNMLGNQRTKGMKFPNRKRTQRHSKETREKISKAFTGSNHWNWQGGKSREPYSVDWTETLRRSIRERDHYLCFVCRLYGNHVHHIDYDKKNCDPNNLITLCHSCHTATNSHKEYWINYFSR